MVRMLTIVPTRGRPAALARVVAAWSATAAFDHAALLFVVDDDDPHLGAYRAAARRAAATQPRVRIEVAGPWQPMVPKLNAAAARHAGAFDALGFAGDDHLPRTPGWPAVLLAELDDMGGGIVHGDDRMWGAGLPTEWTMSSSVVRALGRMVPADVEHLYCDNAVAELGRAAGCLRYVPRVIIEHMHPAVGKAPRDRGYALVNAPRQYTRDEAAFVAWRRDTLPGQADTVRRVLSPVRPAG